MKRAVLALHGFTGSSESFRTIVRAFPERDVVAPALLGHGSTSTARTFDEEVARLAAIRATLPEATTLLGYSLGGRLGLALLAAGVSFEHAVIIGASAGLPTEEARRARREGDARFVRMLREQGIEAFAEAWEAQPLFATQSSERRRAERRAHDPEGLARSLEVLGLAEMPYLLPALVGVRTAIDFVAGARDTKFVEAGRALARAVPSIRLHVVPGVGHDVLLEASEHVVALLLAQHERRHEDADR